MVSSLEKFHCNTVFHQLLQSSHHFSALQCERADLRPIRGPSEISDIIPHQSSACPIHNLLTPFPCTFWCSLYVPNYILIIFDEPLILEGLSTEGTNNGFVNDFTVLYSSSLGPENLIPFLRVRTHINQIINVK